MNNARLGLSLGALASMSLPAAANAADFAEAAALHTAFDGAAMSDATMAEQRGGTAGVGVLAGSYSGGAVIVNVGINVGVGPAGIPANAATSTPPANTPTPAPTVVVSQHHMPMHDAPMQTHGPGGATRPGR